MSLKGDKYETAEEVKFRLEGSVVLYDDKPVYITSVNVPGPEDEEEVARVMFRELPFNPQARDAKRSTRKYLSSRKFDLAPFRMGYMNLVDKALFVSRRPVRQSRQGLCNATTSIFQADGQRCNNVSFGKLIASQAFVEMISGVYPDFKQARVMMEEGVFKSVAIGPTFALEVDADLDALILLQKHTQCGIALSGDKGIRLSRKFHFLKEELEQSKIPLI